MQKQYFSHDYNARNDLKIIAMIKDFGSAGYGIYWLLIETMYEQGGKIKKFPLLFQTLAHDFGVSEKALTKQIEAMLHKYELLQEDENYIWSASVLLRLNMREAKRSTKSESGKLGGLKSGESRRNRKSVKQNEAPLRSIEANEAKERKGKEIKEKEREGETVFPIEHCVVVALNDIRWVKANKTNQEELSEFNRMLEKRGIYEKNPLDYKTHFSNWKAIGKVDGSVTGSIKKEMVI